MVVVTMEGNMNANQPNLKRVEDMEWFLQHSMNPINPRPEFVKKLRGRLEAPMITVTQRNDVQANQLLILAIASFLSGMLIFFTASRVLIALVGIFGLLKYLNRGNVSNQKVAIRTRH
jgi:hypothetical protein